MTDLCWQCQKNNSIIYKSANLTEAEKSSRCRKQEDHLVKVTLERSLYQEMVQKARDTVKNNAIHELCPCDPCSQDITMHYSFDYAQQVHYPSDPLQPGPMYFLTPRKCGLFGINCEAIPRQVNYLIDNGYASQKKRMLWCHSLTTFSSIMAWVKRMWSCIITTVQDKTRTTLCCNTCCGECFMVCMKQSHKIFS